ncbi:MAG TPA: hypothetical protein VMG30_15795 [Acidobacteriota bacterium]|nr:hypothetical protein [Acidobacteriota bacterium]
MKRCKRDAVKPRVEDAERPKPWVSIPIHGRPEWPIQAFGAVIHLGNK